MGEQRQQRGFWESIFSNRTNTEREKKVLEYLIHRINDGAHLRDVVQEEYVRRHASPDEVQQLLDDPRLIESAHESMKADFAAGGSLDPNRPPDAR